MLICNSIITEEYYIRNSYSATKNLTDFGKVSIIMHIGDLDIHVNISNVYLENDKYIIDNDYGCKIVATVRKVDMEFGNILIKHHYYFRQDAQFGETPASELTKFLIDLIHKHEPLSLQPTRSFSKNRSQQKECVDIEIRRQARVLKIDSIV